MSRNTSLSELINYVSASSNGNVTVAPPASGFALEVFGTGRYSGALSGSSATFTGALTGSNATFSGIFAENKTADGIIQTIGGNSTKANIYQFTAGGLAGAVFNIGHNFYYDGTNYGQDNTAKSGWVISSNLNADTFTIARAAAGSTSAPTGYLSLASTGAATFAGNITSLAASGQATIIAEGGATSGEGAIQVKGKNSSGTSRTAQIKYDNSDVIRIGTSAAIAMQFETSDTTRMFIASGGNVGIGTTSPSYNLDVVSASDASLFQVKSTATANNTALRIGIDGNNSFINATGGSTGVLQLRTYGTTRVTIDAAGAATFSSSVTANATSGNSYLSFRSQYDTDSNYRLDITQVVTSGLVKHSFNVVNAGTAYNNNLVLDRGNVGIGTTSPSYLIDVYGSSTARFKSSGAYNTVISDNSNVNGGGGFGAYQNGTFAGGVGVSGWWEGNSTNDIALAADGSRGLRFYTNASEKMRITSGGDVYVGNTSFTSPNGADRFIGVYGGQDCSLILQDAVQLWELYVNDDFYINRGSTNVLTALRSNGNVGIGTTSPSYTLHLKAPSGSTTGLRLESSGGTTNFDILSSEGDGNVYLYQRSNYGILIGTNNTERMRITSAGVLQLGNGSAKNNTLISILEDSTSYQTQFYNSNNKNTFQIGGGSAIGYTEGAYISLMGSDRYGTSTAGVATIAAGNATNNTTYGFIELKTGNSTRMQINYDGRIQTFVNGVNGQFQLFQQSSAYNTDAMMYLFNNRNATSAYNFAKFFSGYPDNTQDIEFNFRGDGTGYSDGGWTTPASDYAEYFESTDGTALQIGSTVVLENGKVKPSTESSTNIIGVIRPKNAALFLGNNEEFKWNQKYLKDDFGAYVLDGEGMRTLNPEYDPNIEYISRENRAEWNVVGLVGQVPILKTQPKHPNWIKMYDVSDNVEMWLIK